MNGMQAEPQPENYQVLAYDHAYEMLFRSEINGEPLMAYRDSALIETLDSGCYHTKPVDRARP